MRNLMIPKMLGLGLGLLVIMALMAATAGLASAARVCSTSAGTHTPTTACGSSDGWVYSGGIAASLTPGGSAVLATVSSSGSVITTVTCTKSEAGGNVNGTTGEGSITSLTFVTSSCSSNLCPNGVHAESENLPWSTNVAFTNGASGTMTTKNVAGEFVCTAAFGFNITCTYSAASATTAVVGSDSAPEIIATNVPLAKTSGPESTCGAKGEFSATYRVTAPTTLFITP